MKFQKKISITFAKLDYNFDSNCTNISFRYPIEVVDHGSDHGSEFTHPFAHEDCVSNSNFKRGSQDRI